MASAILRDATEKSKLAQRLRDILKLNEKTGCMELQQGVRKSGYGQIWAGGKNRQAHRVAWELVNGAIPDGLEVCHKCDNRKCCNPDHLFLGTRLDNVRDQVAKGRHLYGIKHLKCKLTEDELEVVRNSSLRHSQLAKIFNISKTAIRMAREGETWKHIPRSDERMGEIVEIESTNSKFMVNLIDWLDKQPDGSGTTVRLNSTSSVVLQGEIATLVDELDKVAQWQQTAESHRAIGETGLIRRDGEGWLTAIKRTAAEIERLRAQLSTMSTAQDVYESSLRLIERACGNENATVQQVCEEVERLTQYKVLFNHALDQVDRAFQVDSTKPPPILPDFCEVGACKFAAVPKLAQAYKDQAAEIDRLQRELDAAQATAIDPVKHHLLAAEIERLRNVVRELLPEATRLLDLPCGYAGRLAAKLMRCESDDETREQKEIQQWFDDKRELLARIDAETKRLCGE